MHKVINKTESTTYFEYHYRHDHCYHVNSTDETSRDDILVNKSVIVEENATIDTVLANEAIKRERTEANIQFKEHLLRYND
jgi:hypothetical protein